MGAQRACTEFLDSSASVLNPSADLTCSRIEADLEASQDVPPTSVPNPSFEEDDEAAEVWGLLCGPGIVERGDEGARRGGASVEEVAAGEDVPEEEGDCEEGGGEQDDLASSDDDASLFISTLLPKSLRSSPTTYSPVSSLPQQPSHLPIPHEIRAPPASDDTLRPNSAAASSSSLLTQPQEQYPTNRVEKDQPMQNLATLGTGLAGVEDAEVAAEETVAQEEARKGVGEGARKTKRKLEVMPFMEWVVGRGKGEERLFGEEFGRPWEGER